MKFPKCMQMQQKPMFSHQNNVVLKTNLDMKIRILLIERFNISRYVSNYFIFKMIELPVKKQNEIS